MLDAIFLGAGLMAIMLDAIFLGAGLGFFVVAIGYTKLCERL